MIATSLLEEQGALISTNGAAKLAHSIASRQLYGSAVTAPVETTLAPNRIYSTRELMRRAAEPGPFHNFPESFNEHIFRAGRPHGHVRLLADSEIRTQQRCYHVPTAGHFERIRRHVRDRGPTVGSPVCSPSRGAAADGGVLDGAQDLLLEARWCYDARPMVGFEASCVMAIGAVPWLARGDDGHPCNESRDDCGDGNPDEAATRARL